MSDARLVNLTALANRQHYGIKMGTFEKRINLIIVPSGLHLDKKLDRGLKTAVFLRSFYYSFSLEKGQINVI